MRIFIFILFLFVTGNAFANPVCDVGRNKAYSDIKQNLTDRYAPSYSTVEMLLKSNMEAFDEICRLTDTQASNQVLQNLKNRYYPSFSTILMLYKSNMESRQRLNSRSDRTPSQSRTSTPSRQRSSRQQELVWVTKGRQVGAKHESDYDKATQLDGYELNWFIEENAYVTILPTNLEIEVLKMNSTSRKAKVSPVGESTTLWMSLDGIERKR